jgi:hypothetical protein
MWGRLAARLAACAAVGYRRSVVQARAVGRLTIGRSFTKPPYSGVSSSLRMNRFVFQFYVAYPKGAAQNASKQVAW